MGSCRSIAIAAAILFIAWLGLSCSSGDSPLAPGIDAAGDIARPRTRQAQARECLWGIYDIAVDPVSGSVDVVPLRCAGFEANVTRFLGPPIAPMEMLTISVHPDTDFPNGYVVLDVSARHPFPGSNFRGFDVLGVFMAAEGGYVSEWDSALTWPSVDQARLLNADGYTRWWNMVEFTTYGTIFGYTEGSRAVHGFDSTCTLNPFKYFATGLDAEDPFDLEHLMMTDRGSFDPSSPGIQTRRYEIQFPIVDDKPDWRFKYAITSSYYGPNPGAPAPAPTEEFPLTANRAEVVQIDIIDAGSTAFWENETTYGGDLSFNLHITDWQGLKDAMGPTTEVAGIYAESPTLFNGVVNLLDTGGIVWEPPTPTMDVLGCHIPNVTPTSRENQQVLIIATSVEPTDYSPQLPGISGFDYPEDAVLAAFTIWEVEIASTGPQGDPCEPGPTLICSGDGNIFVDSYVTRDDNEQFFRNIINFDYGGPNSYNTIVKYYTGHGGDHNASPINIEIKRIVEDEGFTLVDTAEEPIDTTGCRIIFVCLPGKSGGTPFTELEYESLRTFIDEGGRIVLTQEYSDGPATRQVGNDFLDGLHSTLERLDTSTTYQLHVAPNECEAITHDVGQVYNPAYTSFELGAGDMSFVDDPNTDWHVVVGDWL